MAHDVFVSHSSKDKPAADAVCAVLEAQGIRCWVAPRDILPGRNWGGSIVEAIKGAKAMVLIFSTHANSSEHITREVERAANRGIPIIPVRIENILPTDSLEYFLSSPHWLDAFPPPLDNHLQHLAQVVRQIVVVAPAEPTPVLQPSVVAPEKTEAPKAAPAETSPFPSPVVVAPEKVQPEKPAPIRPPSVVAPEKTKAPAETAPVLAPVVGAVAPEEAEAPKAAVVRPGRSRRVWLPAAAVLLLLLGLGGWYFAVYQPEQRRAAAASAEQARIEAQRRQAAEAEKAWNESVRKRVAESGTAWRVRDLDLEMVFIQPGTFMMGSPASEPGSYRQERPQTQVTLTKGYWLGETEVTQAQWKALMGSNPSLWEGSERPVEVISWNDAMEFCRKLTERERAAGRLPQGYEYTLPTEAQWEYACRAGTTGPYGGDGNMDDMGWYCQNSGNTTHPVGQKRANAWGLYDMHGNVWEWCLDWDNENGYPGGSVRDPTGPVSGNFRVYRGGCWFVAPDVCRSANRYRGKPDERSGEVGFRLALAPTP